MQPMTSLFTAATKRAPLTAAVSDSAENRLTEILAAVLARAPEAARKLVEEWTQEPPKGRLTVTPQRRTADGRYVDLELRYDEEGSCRTSLVWIEVKRDAGPSGEDQLWRYAWELRALLDNHQADSGHLVFLTRPHDWSELFEKFSAVGLGHLWPPKEATWPKLSAALTRWSRTSTEDRWKRELVREFVDYLQEEHVANEGLTLEGTIVLQRFQETDDAFATLLDETDNRLADWGRLEVYDAVPKRSSRAGWTDYYRTYTPLGEVASWGRRRGCPRVELPASRSARSRPVLLRRGDDLARAERGIPLARHSGVAPRPRGVPGRVSAPLPLAST